MGIIGHSRSTTPQVQMTNDTGPSGGKELSGMEQMMLRDLERMKPTNDKILENCELLRRDLARLKQKQKPAP